MTDIADARADWNVEDLTADAGWIFQLDDRARRDPIGTVRRAHDPDKGKLDYRREDFDLGSAAPVIAASFREIRDGRGIALLRGLNGRVAVVASGQQACRGDKCNKRYRLHHKASAAVV